MNTIRTAVLTVAALGLGVLVTASPALADGNPQPGVITMPQLTAPQLPTVEMPPLPAVEMPEMPVLQAPVVAGSRPLATPKAPKAPKAPKKQHPRKAEPGPESGSTGGKVGDSSPTGTASTGGDGVRSPEELLAELQARNAATLTPAEQVQLVPPQAATQPAQGLPVGFMGGVAICGLAAWYGLTAVRRRREARTTATGSPAQAQTA